MTDDFSINELRRLNRETCEAVLAVQDSDIADSMASLERVVQRWQYPMYRLELKEKKVKREELEEQRLRRYLRGI